MDLGSIFYFVIAFAVLCALAYIPIRIAIFAGRGVARAVTKPLHNPKRTLTRR